MTREEAIKVLNTYDVNFDKYTAEEIADAIDMAIEALSANATLAKIQIDDIDEAKTSSRLLDDLAVDMVNAMGKRIVDVVYCKDCIRNNDGNFCDIAFFINDDGNGFCNCGEREQA